MGDEQDGNRGLAPCDGERRRWRWRALPLVVISVPLVRLRLQKRKVRTPSGPGESQPGMEGVSEEVLVADMTLPVIPEQMRYRLTVTNSDEQPFTFTAAVCQHLTVLDTQSKFCRCALLCSRRRRPHGSSSCHSRRRLVIVTTRYVVRGPGMSSGGKTLLLHPNATRLPCRRTLGFGGRHFIDYDDPMDPVLVGDYNDYTWFPEGDLQRLYINATEKVDMLLCPGDLTHLQVGRSSAMTHVELTCLDVVTP